MAFSDNIQAMLMNELNSRAAADGIESLENIRTAMIERRNAALDIMDASDAVLFSHAIWWLSMFVEGQGGPVPQ
jgi:hypothetical protein